MKQHCDNGFWGGSHLDIWQLFTMYIIVMLNDNKKMES